MVVVVVVVDYYSEFLAWITEGYIVQEEVAVGGIDLKQLWWSW